MGDDGWECSSVISSPIPYIGSDKGDVAMCTTVNVKLTDEQMTWLEQEAKRLGTSPEAVLVCRTEEAKRVSTFRHLEFRDAVNRREVYIRGTRLKVWHLMMYSNGDDADIPKLAAEFNVLPEAVADVFAYARTYVDEIEAIFAEIDYISDNIEQFIPGVEVFRLDASHTR
jgi:uncharacterized protein (DUF433 family)